MKSRFVTVAATLVLVACTSTPPAATPEAPLAPAVAAVPTATTAPAVPAAATPAPVATAPAATPPPVLPAIEGTTFEAALAAAHLTRLTLAPIQPARHEGSSTKPMVAEGNQISVTIQGGYNGETVELARDAAGHVVRLVRQPVITTKEIVVQGCEESQFAGGAAWFERQVFDLPPGTTWGGEQIVKYPQVKEVRRFTGKKANGAACPPPTLKHD